MTTRSLRQWLHHLEDRGLLAIVERSVALRFELAGVAKLLDGRRATLFRHVEGHPMPVVSGLLPTRQLVAEACGTDLAGLTEKFVEATRRPLPVEPVDPARAPVREQVRRQDIDLPRLLPAPIHHELD
ncbi:MAG: UbiD family decarboxylase, partial [Candidatus Dormibacteraceae bacterium]